MTRVGALAAVAAAAAVGCAGAAQPPFSYGHAAYFYPPRGQVRAGRARARMAEARV